MALTEIEKQERATRVQNIIEVKKRAFAIEANIVAVAKEEITPAYQPTDKEITEYVTDEYDLDCELNAILKKHGDQRDFYKSFSDVEKERVIKRIICRVW